MNVDGSYIHPRKLTHAKISHNDHAQYLINQYVNNQYDGGQQELADEISEHLGIYVSRHTLHRYLVNYVYEQPPVRRDLQPSPKKDSTSLLYVVSQSRSSTVSNCFGRPQSLQIGAPPSKFRAAHPKAAQIGASARYPSVKLRPRQRANANKRSSLVAKMPRHEGPEINVDEDEDYDHVDIEEEIEDAEQTLEEASSMAECPQPSSSYKKPRLVRCSSPDPFYTIGVKPRKEDKLLVVYEGIDRNYTFTPQTYRKQDGGSTYICLGCHKARYQPRLNARKRGSGQMPDINAGDSKVLCFIGEQLVEKRGRHHRDCKPLTNMEVGLLRVKRAEREFISYVKETALELDLPQQELKKALRSFPLRRWPLDGNKGNKKEAEYTAARTTPYKYRVSDPQEVTLYSSDGVHTTYSYVIDDDDNEGDVVDDDGEDQ